MRNHWYALYQARMGADTDDDVLMRFDTRQERDEFCRRMNRLGGTYWISPCTLKSVARRFNADWFSSPRCEFLSVATTCLGERVPYIRQRDWHDI